MRGMKKTAKNKKNMKKNKKKNNKKTPTGKMFVPPTVKITDAVKAITPKIM